MQSCRAALAKASKAISQVTSQVNSKAAAMTRKAQTRLTVAQA